MVKYKLKFAHNNAIITCKGRRDNMPQIMPITDLRKTNEISDICHKSEEPIFVTKNGYGDLVVMSIETYERLISDTQINAAITVVENEAEDGAALMDAREVLGGLRRKYAK